MRRFVNADIVAGKISNAVTLNRFAYANGNPVYIVSYWNSNSFDSQIHTVVVKSNEVNVQDALNVKTWSEETNASRIFITGYKVSNE